jgi:hypothetical protein
MANTKTPTVAEKGFGDTVYTDADMPDTARDIRLKGYAHTPNANAAAMRGYLRNAPYLEGIIDSPANIREELRLLGYASEDDVVSQYRKRILMQALQDIYNLNPYAVGPGVALTRGMSRTPDAGYTSTTPDMRTRPSAITPGSK